MTAEVGMQYEGEDPFENEPATNTRVAFLGDTHIGKKSPEALSAVEFVEQCENISQNQAIDVVALTGDIIDKTAHSGDISALEQGLRKIVAGGKPVIYVWGNNEDRLEEKHQMKKRLKAVGVIVMDGTESTAQVITLPDGRQQAFVAAPRIITKEQHQAVMTAGSPLDEVLANREILNGEQLDNFKRALASTIPPKGMPMRTIILFHAPEELGMYEEYAQYQNSQEVRNSAKFTEAITQHQERHHNILFGLFGHVEGGELSFNIAGIPFINTCARVIGKEFSVAA